MLHHFGFILYLSSIVGICCVHLRPSNHKDDEISDHEAAFDLIKDEAAMTDNPAGIGKTSLPNQVSAKEAMDIIADRLLKIRSNFGKLPKEFHTDIKDSLGDGTLAGTIDVVRKQSIRTQMSSESAYAINQTLEGLASSNIETSESMHNKFSILAGNGKARELLPMITSKVPPDPSYMFNWMGYHMQNSGMYPEVLDFMKKMAVMHSGHTKVDAQEVNRLINHTQALIQARHESTPMHTHAQNVQIPHNLPNALPVPKPMPMPLPNEILRVVDGKVARGVYKETHNIFTNCFALPCAGTLCFDLCHESHMKKYGPVWEPGEFDDPNGFLEQVFTIVSSGWGYKFQNNFYNPDKTPSSNKAGMKWSFQLDKPLGIAPIRLWTDYDAKLSLRDSFVPACIFYGDNTYPSPKYFSRHLAVANLKKNKFDLGLKMQTGARNPHDFYQTHWYPLIFSAKAWGFPLLNTFRPKWTADFRRKPVQ